VSEAVDLWWEGLLAGVDGSGQAGRWDWGGLMSEWRLDGMGV